MAGNVAVRKILMAAIQKDGVLPAQETAVLEGSVIAVHTNGKGLPHGTGGVFERDVLSGEMVSVNGRGGRFERAERLAIQIRHARVEIEGDDRIRRVITNEMEEGFLPLNIDQFVIGSGFDVNDDGTGRRSRGHGHDGGLKAIELAGTVVGDGDTCLGVKTSGREKRGDDDSGRSHVTRGDCGGRDIDAQRL